MVHVKIFGGLGNQLFQYSFGQYVANKLQTEVHYHQETNFDASGYTKRNFELDYFCLPIVVDDSIQPRLKNTLKSRLYRKWVQRFPSKSRDYFVQRNAHSFHNDLSNKTYYEGYWQNLQYLYLVEEQLKKDLTPNADFLIKFQNLLQIMSQENSASIHIRRDDYINNAKNTKVYYACDMEYYHKAIKKLEIEKNIKRFFVFTQDKQWAKENFREEKFYFVEGNTAIEDMFLMSRCQHNIIANSTFSWWSAWLNPNNEKMVIAPKKWYKNYLSKYIGNLLPKNWIKL